MYFAKLWDESEILIVLYAYLNFPGRILKHCGTSEERPYNMFRDYAGTTASSFRICVKLKRHMGKIQITARGTQTAIVGKRHNFGVTAIFETEAYNIK